MIGFIVGTVCLVALIAQLARHRYGYHGYYAMQHARGFHRGFGHHSRHYGHHRGYGWHGGSRRAVLYDVLARLDTSPGQDRAIKGAVELASEQLRDVREPLRELRKDLGIVMQGEDFDRAAVEAVFTRTEGRLREVRATLVQALEQVHAALDPEQRKRLSRMIADGYPEV